MHAQIIKITWSTGRRLNMKQSKRENESTLTMRTSGRRRGKEEEEEAVKEDEQAISIYLK